MSRAFVTGGSGFVGQHLIRALRARGLEVRALARSERARDTVRALGAEPVAGDLDDEAAMRAGMSGCTYAFHLAALLDHTRGEELLRRVNVEGTGNALGAARTAGVRRFVHLSTAAVFAGGPPLVDATEGWPVPERPVGPYPRTKALAEQRVLRAHAPPDFEVVILRPAFVWGPGDASTLPLLVGSARRRRFSWIAGGRFPLSTCHVRNLCEGLVLAAERAHGGDTYFLTDGPPIEQREFLTGLLRAQGVEPGNRSVPRWLMRAFCALVELPSRVLRPGSAPPDHLRLVLELLGQEHTVRDDKARRELGYTTRVSREEGLAELAAAAGRTT